MSVEGVTATHESEIQVSKFNVLTIPADAKGCQFYLEQYKPFRLASLQRDAHAFGSTYAREIAFDDDAWLNRVKNPLATTFVAVRSDNNQVVASTSMIGPLPKTSSPVSNPYQVVSQTAPPVSSTSNNGSNENDDNKANDEPLYFQMAAVYTSPEARGRGLAKALIRTATDEARSRAQEQGRALVLSVVVYAANSAAISVYERCGFVKSAEEPKLVFNPLKNTSEKELEMYFGGKEVVKSA
ncbi:hypothetical protein F4777DRAFT_249724 [Nemania sp. FL0916]|nr:hypothetical protein F4777DRAFT_249724 [Nemania sp. FL0916]